ncbi:MAG: hypothetical protein HKN25_01630 [Pyrinomonadaceae bacterium]|nr:hypothetical protein [Pyrinomonadaceae bacterium]
MQELKMPEKTRRASKDSGLITRLLETLDADNIQYCHWKSNWRIGQWLEGKGDLDLLIGRHDITKFAAVLSGLGFKKAIPPREKEVPGVVNFYGYDPKIQDFINVHAHYQLVFGNELTNNYRLPVERSLLAGSNREGIIFVASHEMELVLFVIRTVLKFSALERLGKALIGERANCEKKIFGELNYLEDRVDPEKLESVLHEQFQFLDKQFFNECLALLGQKSSLLKKMELNFKMKKALSDYSRSHFLIEHLTRAKRGLIKVGRKLLRKKNPGKRFEGGGMLLAFVGGDGAGKTTSVNEISKWLSRKFEVRNAHLGKPPKSFLTLLVGAVLKIRRKLSGSSDEFGSKPIFLQRLRWLCTARDRYRLYKRIRRDAANGLIVICDRYPIPNLNLMDAPKIPDETGGRLVRIEKRFYRNILPPEQLFVLRVEPNTAVDRKPDEPSPYVFRRSKELWKIDWRDSNACLIDANRPLDSVLSDLRNRVWASL